MSATGNWGQMLSFIWSVKEDLRGPYKAHQYGQIILPMVVLRRLDGILETADPRNGARSRKQAVLDRAEKLTPPYDNHEDLLKRVAGLEFYNTSKFSFDTLLSDQEAVLENFTDYLNGFSPDVREVIAAFDLISHVEKLARAGRLYSVLGRFADTSVDLSPEKVSNHDMGYLYEELIREVNALQKEEAGEHFTPREVGDLLGALLVADSDDLHADGKVITVYDPTAGTGGLLTIVEQKLLALNPKLRVHLRGQEIQEESFAICRSDMLIRGEQSAQIRLGDTLKDDKFAGEFMTYCAANPPYGMDWKNAEEQVKHEHKTLGTAGRFGPGLPSTEDGQMLFLLHMFSKLKPKEDGGGRMAVVLNGSPLFAGPAESGPSEIRRFFVENDHLEAIVALPNDMFYNTGIPTYVWVVTNNKRPERQGLVQLIDARDLYAKMPKSLGNKRNRFTQEHIKEIVRIYEAMLDDERSKMLPNAHFGYRAVTVEHPLRVSWLLEEEQLEALRTDKALAKLDPKSRAALLDAAEANLGWTATSLEELVEKASELLAHITKPTKPVREAVRKALQVRDAAGVALPDKSVFVADAQLRETVLLSLDEDVDAYFDRELRPYAPEAWLARDKDKIGYEILVGKIFYRPVEPRPLVDIDKDIEASQQRILQLLRTAQT